MAGDGGRPRVVVELRGRLGNQMFQYAAGRALATRLGANLVLDVTMNRRLDRPGAGMAPFGLGAPRVDWGRRIPSVARPLDVLRWLHCRATGRRMRWAYRLAVFRQRGHAIPDTFFARSESCVLVGFWQSERCFAPVADRIRRDFALDRFATERAAPVLAEIDAGPSVAVHVRRGDYVKLADESTFTLCGRDYYDRAREVVEGRIGTARWFVFSDEPETARELLGDWPGARFVAGFDEYQDMMLMARCDHHVIANSSFSWWAAWLGEGPGTTVVAPRQWFAPDAGRDTRDLLPPRWLAV